LTAVRVVPEGFVIEGGRAIIVVPEGSTSISAYTTIHRKEKDDWLMEHVVES